MEHVSTAVVVAAIGLFVIGYAFIALEHTIKLNKSGVALFVGSLLWILAAAVSHDKEEISMAIGHETQEIFSIVIFLLAAMTIVETLIHYKLFDWIREQIIQREISQAKLFWLLGAITFFGSALLDNLTTTLIMIQIGRTIYRNKSNFIVYVAAVIIAANAGGAWSPIGDVTTILLWLADKFSATDIITGAILPSLAMWIIPHALLSRKISAHEEAEAAHKDFHLTSKDDDNKPIWAVIIVGLASFTLPVVFNIVGLPPFLGLLTGLGALWIVTDWLNRHEAHESHASDEGKILSIIQKTDISTLKFFIGILLAVGALKHLGILGELSTALFGDGSSTTALISGSVLLGAISSILDNVPLVAASLNVFPDGVNPAIWELLALTAGTGGSLLVIGSAAGVAAMGQVKELTFVKYFKLATLPALAGYVAGIAVWLVMNRGL